MAQTNKKFAVLLFELDNSVEVAPYSWLQKTEAGVFCPWPKRISTVFRANLSKSDSKPMKEWKLYKVTLKDEYDNYSEALANAQERLIPTADENSEASGSRRKHKKKRSAILDVQPPTSGLFQSVEVHNSGLSSELTTLFETSSVVSTATTPIRNPNETVPADEVGLEWNLVPINTLEELRAEQRNGISELVKKVESLIEEQKEMKSLLQRVLSTNNSKEEAVEIPPLPLRTQKDLNDLETWVDDASRRAKLKSLLTRVGGDDVPKNVFNVLKTLISHELALQLRFTGSSGKVPFGITKTCEIVREVVAESQPLSLPTDQKLNDCIGRWLRNSIDRSGGRLKRKPTVNNVNPTPNQTTTDSNGSAENISEDSNHIQSVANSISVTNSPYSVSPSSSKRSKDTVLL